MKLSDLDYHLPEESIAQRPLAERQSSRLLVLDRSSGQREHRHFSDLPDLLGEPSLLVVNNTRVFPARIEGRRPTGGKVELLLLRPSEETPSQGQSWLCLGKPQKKLRPGTQLSFDDLSAVVKKNDGHEIEVAFASEDVRSSLGRHGKVPLPPYIRREPDSADSHRYQTVYAERSGSVAAPTAGLHFTESLLAELKARGHGVQAVTLHVGPGTFLPVREETVESHHMHAEQCEVTAEAATQIAAAKKGGRKIVAVGTTVVRVLESVAKERGHIEPWAGLTELFITPGHRFAVVDRLITNFHLPRSTLLALVCAFAGREHVLDAYRSAVERQYRFYSYGDAMFLR